MLHSSFENLINTAKKTRPSTDIELIRRAYAFANDAHRNQFRINGEPYINHVVSTAYILLDWQLPTTIVVAGLLHDAPEDTTKTLLDIEHDFGVEIARIVEGETKLDRLKYVGMTRYVENLRKLFLAVAKDVRVVFVKFADRLHNLMTIEVLPPEKKYRIARESLEIYAPIAGRLGMGEIKAQLEDLSFPHVYPDEFKWLMELIKGKYEAKEQELRKEQKILESELHDAHIPYERMYGRTKHIYSLYRKLLKYDRDFSKVYDLVAIRVIVNTIAECYSVLGVIHSQWKPLKGRIKDYIATPKPNGYQSLHTTVFGKDGGIVEFQIRTKGMHEEAEYGIAAHWRYDESGKKVPVHSRRLHWMQELARIQKELEDRKTFVETLEELKIDLFQNRIFIFTPKGDVLDLPEHSTPVDLAYAIHSDIGNQCASAKINGEMVPLDQKLTSGDIVEIIVDKKRKGPSADWLKFVKTRNARNKIKARAKRGVAEWFSSILPKKK